MAQSGEAEAASRACATLAAVRVLIADDHRLILDGIKRALEADGDFEIVGETQNGTQVLPLVGQDETRPRPARRPHAAHGRARVPRRDPHAPPDVKVVMLSASTTPELIEARCAAAPAPTSSRP